MRAVKLGDVSRPLRIDLVVRRGVDADRRGRLVRLLAKLLDKPAAPDEGR